MTASLLTLPKEVFDAVVGHLDVADVAACRMLCKRARDLLPWDGSLCLTIDDKWPYSEQFMHLAETLPLLKVRHLSIAAASCPYVADTLRYPSHARVLASWARCTSWGVHTLLGMCAATLESAEVSCDVPLPGLAKALAQCPQLQHVCVTLPPDNSSNTTTIGSSAVDSGSAAALGRSFSSLSSSSSSSSSGADCDDIGGDGSGAGPNAAALSRVASSLLLDAGADDLQQLKTVVLRLGQDSHHPCLGGLWGDDDEAEAAAGEGDNADADADACCPSLPLPIPGAVNAAAQALLPEAVAAAAAKRGVAVAVLAPPPAPSSCMSDASEMTVDDGLEEGCCCDEEPAAAAVPVVAAA